MFSLKKPQEFRQRVPSVASATASISSRSSISSKTTNKNVSPSPASSSPKLSCMKGIQTVSLRMLNEVPDNFGVNLNDSSVISTLNLSPARRRRKHISDEMNDDSRRLAEFRSQLRIKVYNEIRIYQDILANERKNQSIKVSSLLNDLSEFTNNPNQVQLGNTLVSIPETTLTPSIMFNQDFGPNWDDSASSVVRFDNLNDSGNFCELNSSGKFVADANSRESRKSQDKHSGNLNNNYKSVMSNRAQDLRMSKILKSNSQLPKWNSAGKIAQSPRERFDTPSRRKSLHQTRTLWNRTYSTESKYDSEYSKANNNNQDSIGSCKSRSKYTRSRAASITSMSRSKSAPSSPRSTRPSSGSIDDYSINSNLHRRNSSSSVQGQSLLLGLPSRKFST